MTPEITKKFVKSLLSRHGCYYCWPTKENGYSGKDIPFAKFKSTYDCSGLITASLSEATDGAVDHRRDWNAGHIMQHCEIISIDEAQSGDLCFYGLDSTPEHISHVMALVDLNGYLVCYGSSGGGSKTVTVDIAKKQDARVRWFSSPNYRRDLIAVGRLKL